jgi:hypothetical protein
MVNPQDRSHEFYVDKGQDGKWRWATQEVTREQLETLERVAVTTFSDMVSAGHTFQAALAAVYYSGVVHTLETING